MIDRLLWTGLLIAATSSGLPVGTLSAGPPAGPLIGFASERTWSDQTGRFQVSASLAFADRQEVRLRKADGKEVTVPLAKLSTADQRFIEGFLAAETALMDQAFGKDDTDNPFAGGSVPSPPPLSASSIAAVPNRPSGLPTRPGSSPPRPGDARGSLPPLPSLADGSTAPPVREPVLQGIRPLAITPNQPFWEATPPRGFAAIAADDIVIQTPVAKPFFASMQVLAAREAGTVLLNVYQQGRGNREEFSRFVIVRPDSGQVSPGIEFQQPWKAVAISPDGTRIAAVRIEGFDKGNDLAIFRIVDQSLIPEFQFRAGGGSFDELQWVAFLPDQRLATISQKHDLTCWDLAAEPGPRAIQRGKSGGTVAAEISPAGELMFLPIGQSIAALQTDTGKLVGCLQRDQAANRIAIAPSGKLLAAYHPYMVTLHDLSSGETVREVAVGEGNPQATLRWIGNHLRVGKVLYDVETGMPLWSYETKSQAETAWGDLLVSAFGNDQGSSVVLSRLPHDEPLRRLKEADPSQIHAIVPGIDVSVRFTLDAAPADVQQAIQSAVEENLKRIGWNLVPQSTNTVEVKLERGEQEEAEYFTRRGFGPGPIFAPPGFRPDGPSEKVQVRPWIHSLQVKSAGAELFTARHVRGAPQSLQTKDDESTQAAVDRYVRPDPNYFKQLTIPTHVLKQAYREGLGKSTIDPSGIH